MAERISRIRGVAPDAAVRESSRDAGSCTSQRLGEAPADALLSIRGLCVAYAGRVVLDQVDLDVREGRITALIGPSGCGKTSLLFAINRLSDLVPGCSEAVR